MKSSAMCRLCPALGDRDEIRSLAKSKPGGELAHPRSALQARHGTERERAGEVAGALDGDDRSPVDPLAELAPVDLDEGGERRARGEELKRERLPGRTRAPDDPRAAAREQCPTQEVPLAAAERGKRVRRPRAGEPLRVVAPAVDERVHVAEPAAAFPDPENEVVVLGPALIAVGDELGPGGQAGAGQRALDPEIAQRGLDGDERVQ